MSLRDRTSQAPRSQPTWHRLVHARMSRLKVMRKMPLSLDDSATVIELGEILRAAAFDAVHVGAAVGVQATLSMGSEQLVEMLARLPAGAPLSILIRLLVFGVPVDVHEVDRVLSPLGWERLKCLGLLQVGPGAQVRSSVRIVPYGHLLVACDHERGHRRLPRDHVPGVHGSSVLLASLTPRSHSSSTFDLGAGCGVQSLLAAEHSDHVVASDTNSRALAFASFNTLLNGIETVEIRQGPAFQPVVDERFDLIVCNPPYVISPESAHHYKNSGLAGDELCEKIVNEAPHFLADGGFACILVSWAISSGEDWWVPLQRWIPASGCDVLALKVEIIDALANATRWIAVPEGSSLADRQRIFDRWRAYYDSKGVEFIGYGAVVLRKSHNGRYWKRFETLRNGPSGPAGDQIGRIFAGQDYLASLQRPDTVLSQVFTPAPSVQIEQALRYSANGWEGALPAAVRDDRLGVGLQLTPHGMQLLTSMDGRRTLGQVLEAMGPRSPGSAAGVALVTDLIGRGLLVPQPRSEHAPAKA
jgi:methylase of polypeptide subunit release factors